MQNIEFWDLVYAHLYSYEIVNSLCWYYNKPIHLKRMNEKSCSWKGRFLCNSASWGLTEEHFCWKGPWNHGKQQAEHEHSLWSGTPEVQLSRGDCQGVTLVDCSMKKGKMRAEGSKGVGRSADLTDNELECWVSKDQYRLTLITISKLKFFDHTANPL